MDQTVPIPQNEYNHQCQFTTDTSLQSDSVHQHRNLPHMRLYISMFSKGSTTVLNLNPGPWPTKIACRKVTFVHSFIWRLFLQHRPPTLTEVSKTTQIAKTAKRKQCSGMTSHDLGNRPSGWDLDTCAGGKCVYFGPPRLCSSAVCRQGKSHLHNCLLFFRLNLVGQLYSFKFQCKPRLGTKTDALR